jgi:hypothetical protein
MAWANTDGPVTLRIVRTGLRVMWLIWLVVAFSVVVGVAFNATSGTKQSSFDCAYGHSEQGTSVWIWMPPGRECRTQPDSDKPVHVFRSPSWTLGMVGVLLVVGGTILTVSTVRSRRAAPREAKLVEV